MKKYCLVAMIASCGAASSALANPVIFEDDFNDGMAVNRWSGPIFSSELNPQTIDGAVDYAFDYSTLTGLNPAPGVAPNTDDGSTVGIGIQVNNTNQPVDEGEAIGISPIIPGGLTDYALTVDAFVWYNGAGGGTSEHFLINPGNDGVNAPFIFEPAGTGVTYHIPHNSGLSNPGFDDDYYRVNSDPGNATDALYGSAPGNIDPSTLGITFDGVDPVFDDAGYPGNRWFTLELVVVGDTAEVYINGTLIDVYTDPNDALSGDVLLGGADIFNSANPDNWIIFDNVRIIPSPAAAGLFGLAGLAAARRRRA